MKMIRAGVVLEREWLWSLEPSLKRSYHHNMLEFEKDGRTFVIQGEHDVPNSPLICSLELQKFMDRQELRYICYGFHQLYMMYLMYKLFQFLK